MKKKQQGFTLIEVMIAMTIVAILVAIGLPVFQNYQFKQQRAEAVALLSNLHLEMERCKSSQPNIADLGTYTGCGATALANISINPQYYNAPAIAIAGDGLSYTITATHTTATDVDCLSLSITNLGNKTFTGASPNNIRCWGSN